MAVAALVLGILTILFMFIPYVGWLGVLFGILAIIFGALGRKQPHMRGMATAGFVCGIVGTALGAIVLIACAACVGAVGTAAGLGFADVANDMYRVSVGS
jgi:hypothetical protein